MYKTISKSIEIEEATMVSWLRSGGIKIYDIGNENVYFINDFNMSFYCKCYPRNNGTIDKLQDLQSKSLF